MVKFLLHRPIAVSMSFFALILLGIITAFRLPVSLLPALDIPKITIQVSRENASAREIENALVLPLRRQLMQISHLENIKSEVRDGSGLIHLDFEHGTNIDYAFIETNEKIDRIMGQLPADFKHPKVIKASASDIPVFFLNLTLKNQETSNQDFDRLSPHQETRKQHPASNELYPVSQTMLDLSNFSEQVIKKRLEQLPEVAMIDISGLFYSEILILPDLEKLKSLNLSLLKFETQVKNQNIDLGNLIIRDGQYQFNIRFSNTLRNVDDIKNIYFKVDEKVFKLKDIASVIEHPQKPTGKVTTNGKNAVSMAVIKQSSAQLQDVKEKLDGLINEFKKDYPHIDFHISRDQSQLLTYSIDNLRQSLLLGTLLALLVMLFFLKDFKSPLLISISVPASLLLTFLFFYLSGISINIISLSGLILGLGMMIDNSIIVIDNISQHIERGKSLVIACAEGTNEVIRPLLSSILTTCAVFIPLVFVGGIASSLFYEQAISITIGLFVSFAVSISLLPVYFKIFHLKKRKAKAGFLEKINKIDYNKIYEKGFRLVMRNQFLSLTVFFLMMFLTILLYHNLKLERLPELEKNETLVNIDWNQRVTIEENQKRTEKVIEYSRQNIEYNFALIGEQQYLLNLKSTSTSSEAVIYIKTKTAKALHELRQDILQVLSTEYPDATVKFEDAGNIFNIIFSDNEANLIAKLRTTSDFGENYNQKLNENIQLIADSLPKFQIPGPSFKEVMILKSDPVQLSLYDVDFQELYSKLQTALSDRQVYIITSGNQFLPVIIGEKPSTIMEIIENTMVQNKKGEQIPIRNFLSKEKDLDLKTIIAGQEGEYYPIDFNAEENEIEELQSKIIQTLKKNGEFEASFGGSYFTNRELLRNLLIILLISVSLLYFILASQFESLTLPLIVLLEIPIDIFGAFLMLKIFGASINLMSMIGIIVMSGIIINDSILKIDTINKLRQDGYHLMHALVEAGHRRLKPILMTSLTTILALLPFLFTSGMGADLQKPLALAIIGGMTIGTIVSLYFIPLFYYYLKRNTEIKSKDT
jgi:multidrug efflux pump subunit AcrB